MLDFGVNDLLQATPAGQSLEEALAHAAENLANATRDYLEKSNLPWQGWDSLQRLGLHEDRQS